MICRNGLPMHVLVTNSAISASKCIMHTPYVCAKTALITHAIVRGREAKMIFKSVIVRSAVCAAIACAAIGANSAKASVVNFTLTQGTMTDSWSLDSSSVPSIGQIDSGNYDVYFNNDEYSHSIAAAPAGVNVYTTQTGLVPWFEMSNYNYNADFSTDRPFFQTPGTHSFSPGIYQLSQYGPFSFGGSGPATLTISVGLAPTAPAPLAGSGALSAFAALAAFGMTRLRKRKAFAA